MRIHVVDDHDLIRHGTAGIIRSIDPAIEVGFAGSFEEALALAASAPADLVLLDLNLPDAKGVDVLAKMRERAPDTSIVVVSAQEDAATVLGCLERGAKAFIPKSADANRLREAIEALLEGRLYLPSTVPSSSLPKAAQALVDSGGSGVELSDRQREVLAYLVAGMPNKRIAQRLDIAEATVKIHVSAILRAFKVSSRTQVLIAVAKTGMKLPRP